MVTAGQFFSEAKALPFASLERIVGPGGVIVVAPHPDDESLGCGGLIATARSQGRAVTIIIISDGCGSHPNSKTHPPDRLRDLREAETLQAAGFLGVAPSNVVFLRLPDRYVPASGEAAIEAARAIEKAARNIDASAILATWENDPHCDHQAAWEIAALAHRSLNGEVLLLAYPIWGWVLPPDMLLDGPPKGRRLAIDDSMDAKRRAIEAHRSQLTGMVENDPPVIILPETVLAPFKERYEIFLEGQV